MPVDLLCPSRRDLFGIAAAGLAASAGEAWSQTGQTWPSRPVTMLVPYGPGASNDIFTRALSSILSKRLGQPFVVENRAGAGGFTGSNAVAQSAPDGYTFLEMPNSIASFSLIMKVKLDPLADLTPVALLARSPIAMVINAAVPARTVQEFIDYAKTRPDQMFYGHAGIGTTQHQHAEMFKRLTGLKMRNVNYKSSADAQTDLVAGRLQVMFVTVASTLGQIQAGQLRLLAYTDKNYAAGSPPAPTLAEIGLPGMEKAQSWWGIFGPQRLPVEIRDRMNAAINAAIQEPEFVELLARSSATPAPVTPAEFAETIKQEIVLVEDFIKNVGIQ